MINNPTEQQKAILNSTEKRIVVLACPGSGKTAILTEKMIQYVKRGASVKNMIALTFTQKAAGEMRDRIMKELPLTRSEQGHIRTIHSLGAWLLSWLSPEVGLKKDDYLMASREDKIGIAKEILPENKQSDVVVNEFLDFVSTIKNGGVSDNEDFDESLFESYCKKMIDTGFIDMDDLVYLPVKILQNNKYLCEKIRKMYSYIFVDEYQDINNIQNDFLNLITSDSSFVFLVGDDDQSIYEFRGSRPDLILSKTEDNSLYKTFFMTINFRSQKNIVDLSKKVLEPLTKDGLRRNKVIESFKTDSKNKPIRKMFDSKEEELNYVANEIYRLITESRVLPNEIAVLARYGKRTDIHPELSDLQKLLSDRNISSRRRARRGDNKEDSRIIRNLCAVLNAYYTGELNDKVLNAFENHFRKRKFDPICSIFQIDNSLSITERLSLLSNVDLSKYKDKDPIEEEKNKKLIGKYLKHYSFAKNEIDSIKSGKMPSDIISDIIKFISDGDLGYEEKQEIYESAYSFCKSSEEEYEPIDEKSNKFIDIVKGLNAFLCDQTREEDSQSVNLLTAHQSKGLQFDIVFVVGMEAGNFPCNLEPLEGENLTNERRLFYVCITRARELLYLTANHIATDDTADLAGKNFVFNLPTLYFDEKPFSLDDIHFSYESDRDGKELAKKDELIEQYDKEKYILTVELAKYKEQIQKIESINSSLVSDSAEQEEQRQNNEKEIARLLRQIELQEEKSKKNDSYLKKLKDKQENQELLIKKYLDRINELNSMPSSKDIEKEKAEVIGQLNQAKIVIASNEKEQRDLSEHIKELEHQNSELESEINDIKANPSAYFESIKAKVEGNIEEQKQDDDIIEVILKSIVNQPNEVISDNTKENIKSIYSSIVLSHRYPLLEETICTGLITFSRQVKATISYNSKLIGDKLYATKITPANYKGSLDNLVRGIIRYLGDWDEKRNGELGLSRFFGILLDKPDIPKKENDKYTQEQYERCVQAYKNSRSKPNISRNLLENMWLLSTITTSISHGANGNTVRNDPVKVFYQKTIHDFLESSNINRYQVFSSFFDFIYMFIFSPEILTQISI